MLSDRLTARILGAVASLMTFAIVVGALFFTKPEIRARSSFPVVVLVFALPPAALAAWLFRRASQMKG